MDVLIGCIAGMGLLLYGGLGIWRRKLVVPIARAPEYTVTLDSFVAVGFGSLCVITGLLLMLGVVHTLLYSSAGLIQEYLVVSVVTVICGFFVITGLSALWLMFRTRTSTRKSNAND